MRVFLIPVPADRYELYCEVPDDAGEQDEAGERPGFLRRVIAKSRRTVESFERQRRTGAEPRGLWSRIAARFGLLLAEAIAEQRLLWHLRGADAATAVHPDDMDGSTVMPIVRARVQQDYEKHRFWLAIDALLLIGSALLAVLPGPNLIAYYFAFRVVGHFLSIRGARQALTRVAWSLEPSTPLTELRRLVPEPPDARHSRLDAIASALGLVHLPRFFDRVAAPGA